MVEWRGRQITKDSQIVTSHVNVRWCEMTLCLSNQLLLNWDFRLKLRRGRSWSAISICWPGHESKSLSRVKNREKHISWSRLPMTPTTNNPKPSKKKNRTHLLQTHLKPQCFGSFEAIPSSLHFPSRSPWVAGVAPFGMRIRSNCSLHIFERKKTTEEPKCQKDCHRRFHGPPEAPIPMSSWAARPCGRCHRWQAQVAPGLLESRQAWMSS